MSPISWTLGTIGPVGMLGVGLMLALASGPQGASAKSVALRSAKGDLAVYGALVPLSASAAASKPWTAIRTDMMATGSIR